MQILKKTSISTPLALLSLLLAACMPAAAPAPPTTAAPEETPAAESGPGGDFLLVLQTGNGVETIQPDGGKRSSLPGGVPPSNPAVLFTVPAAGGPPGRFALIDVEALSLSIYSSPDQQPEAAIQLLANPEINDEQKSAYRDVLTSDNPPAFVWSPDGRAAVFLAAIDHPYLELYHYDCLSRTASRLSEGTGDAYQPSWSPDGQWVVYDETDGLNTIGLWAVTAVKAVRANASQAVTLYEPQSWAETRLGWSSPSSFVVHSARERDPVDLREVGLDGSVNPIFNGLFSGPAYDAAGKQAGFILNDAFVDEPSQTPGIYLASKDWPPALLAPGDWTSLAWNPAAGVFLAVREPSGVSAIAPSGEAVQFEGEAGLPAVSKKGDLFAFAGADGSHNPGLRLYSPAGGLIAAITPEPVDGLWFLPDGSLAYSRSGSLFRLVSPDSRPSLLAEDADLLGWLGSAAAP